MIHDPYRLELIDITLLCIADKRYEEALATLALTLGNSGDDGYVLYVLGYLNYQLKRMVEAEQLLRLSVQIDPTRAVAFNDLGAALFALHREAEALSYIRRALDLQPDLPEAEESDGIWMLRYGQFREGWRKYEARTRTLIGGPMYRQFPQPQWYGEPLDGRTILLHAEQGLGDTIQFARYVPLVAARGGRVILEMYPPLLGVMSRLAGISVIVPRETPLPAFDLHCPLMSLPLAFQTDLDSIPAAVPYLRASEDRVYRWRTRLGPRRGKRIGIVWSGNPKFADDSTRTIPLERFRTVLAPHRDREFHIIQAFVRAEDKPILDTMPHVHDHSGSLHDFDDTAAMIALMDLVISVDTSVAHLAGAMGWPVWLLVSAIADWRWMLNRDDSPWYPTMWLFRQQERDGWEPVLQEVARQLDLMLT